MSSGEDGAGSVERLLSEGFDPIRTPGEAGGRPYTTQRATSPGPHEPFRSRPARRPDHGSAVPSPAFAFLLSLIALPSLFWLVTLKRTTDHTVPEDWLMMNVVPPIQHWVMAHAPFLDALLVGISGLGSGWFVGLGFGVAGLVASGGAGLTWPSCWRPGRWPSRSSGRSSTSRPSRRSALAHAGKRAASTFAGSAWTTSPTSPPGTRCAPRSSTACSRSAWRGSAWIGGAA